MSMSFDFGTHLTHSTNFFFVFAIGYIFVRQSLTASTLLHRLVLSIELGTVQTGNGNVDPARKFKCTTALAACDREDALYVPYVN